MKNKICALITVLGVLCSSSVFAFEAVYYSEKDSVATNGENDSDAIVLAIMPYIYTVDKLTEEMVNSMPNVMFKSVSAGGKYENEILLSDVMDEGKYRICEVIEGNAKSAVFIRIKSERENELINAVNRGDKSAFVTLIKRFAADALLDLTQDSVLELAEKIYNIKPDSGYTSETFYKNLTAAEGLFSFKNSKLSLEDYFEEYKACIDDKLVKKYEVCTEAQKLEAEKCASGIDFLNGDISDALSEILFVATIHSASNFKQLRTFVEEFAKENNVSLSAYDSLKQDYQKNNVFIKLFDERKNLDNEQDVISRVEKLADEEKKDSGKNQPSQGGSGGGGGSMSGNSTSFAPDITESDNNSSLFSDINSHWAKDSIEKMNSLGIVNGFEDKTFKPDNKVTRAEFVKMLVKVLNIPGGGECSFEDVSDNDWFRQCVADAVNAGLVSGVTVNRFAPYNELTRQDAAVMVYRAVKEKLSVDSNMNFNDENVISDYALDAVKALSSAGIVNGSDGCFYPMNGITRAEAVTLLLRVHGIV